MAISGRGQNRVKPNLNLSLTSLFPLGHNDFHAYDPRTPKTPIGKMESWTSTGAVTAGGSSLPAPAHDGVVGSATCERRTTPPASTDSPQATAASAVSARVTYQGAE